MSISIRPGDCKKKRLSEKLFELHIEVIVYSEVPTITFVTPVRHLFL